MMPFVIALAIGMLASGIISAYVYAKTVSVDVSVKFFLLGQKSVFEDSSPEVYAHMLKKAEERKIDLDKEYLHLKERSLYRGKQQ